jgi:hypothetical protein
MDLGYKMDMGPSEPPRMPEKMWPNLHLEWPSDYDLPESGEMTVTFKKTGENKSKDRNGKTRYTVDLEIKTIESVEAGEEEGESEEESGSDALDRHMKDKMAESDEEY